MSYYSFATWQRKNWSVENGQTETKNLDGILDLWTMLVCLWEHLISWHALFPSSSVGEAGFHTERLIQTLNVWRCASLPFLLKILDWSLSALWYSMLLVTFYTSRFVECWDLIRSNLSRCLPSSLNCVQALQCLLFAFGKCNSVTFDVAGCVFHF